MKPPPWDVQIQSQFLCSNFWERATDQPKLSSRDGVIKPYKPLEIPKLSVFHVENTEKELPCAI